MALQINNVNKCFNNGSGAINALLNINLAVKPGQFVCIVGPSGCGKSTLLSLIAGLEIPEAGTITVNGKIGFMFQEPALFPWLTVKDNIGFGLKMAGVDKNTINERVKYHLDMVHLTKFADHYPHELSGGMKQRVALARTLIMDPDILLMDEPFGALDAQTREILYQELQEIWQKTSKTIIFVTHNVREAVCLGDRVNVFTSRPGTIKKEFVVELARPRSFADLELITISNNIMAELKEEIDKVIAEIRN